MHILIGFSKVCGAQNLKFYLTYVHHLVTTQHPQGMSSYLTVVRQQV